MENEKQTFSHKLFTIRDSKANCFDNRILVQRTTAEGLRTFQTLAQDDSNSVGKFPEDFSFFELGEYDERTGRFNIYASPNNLGLAAQFKQPNGNVEKLKEVR